MSLFDEIDAAAQALLRRARGEGSIPAASADGAPAFEDPPPPAPLAEQVKAFEAVVEWARVRKDVVVAAPKESPIRALANRVNGHAPRRRGASAAPVNSEEDGPAGTA